MFGNFFWYSNYNRYHSNKEDMPFGIKGFTRTEEKLFDIPLKNWQWGGHTKCPHQWSFHIKHVEFRENTKAFFFLGTKQTDGNIDVYTLSECLYSRVWLWTTNSVYAWQFICCQTSTTNVMWLCLPNQNGELMWSHSWTFCRPRQIIFPGKSINESSFRCSLLALYDSDFFKKIIFLYLHKKSYSYNS